MAREKVLKVRMSQEEYDRLAGMAISGGTTMANLVREALSRIRPWTLEDRRLVSDLVKEVHRMGVNLNQLARWVNTHKSGADCLRVYEALLVIQKDLHELLEAVRGGRFRPRKATEPSKPEATGVEEDDTPIAV